MSKERAQRRAEREAAAAALAVTRAAQEERQARRAARSRRLSRIVPTSTVGRQTGLLAERRRRELLATLALLIVVNLLVFAVARDHGLTALMLVASVLGFPIVHMMLFRRT